MAKGNGEQRPVRRWDPERKPTIGGIALYIVFLLCLSMAYSPYFGGSSGAAWLMGCTAAASLAFLMGLSDDVQETRPWLKLAVQTACGGILVWTGTVFHLQTPFWIEASLTILWTILIMNSFNMIDNMDGIAGGIGLCVLLLALLMTFKSEGESELELLLLGMSAALLAFLYHNVHPSKIFLGDAGTQFLGLLLAIIGVRVFWISSGSGDEAFNIFEKGLLFLLPFWPSIADTLSVFILRILRGNSPLVGGKDHTTHSFSYAGLSERGVNLLFFLWSAVNALLFFVVVHWTGAFRALGPTLFAYILITFALVFYTAHRAGKA